MPVTAPETVAINPRARAPGLPEDHRRNNLLPLSYDFRLFLPRPGEDVLITARRATSNNGALQADTTKETRKRQSAEALLVRLPTLQLYQFPYEQIATFERISPEQARDKYRHLELNSSDGGNGILITLRDDEASVSLPFWHESGRAEQALQEAWICLESIRGQTGYAIYDLQAERMVNLEADASSVLASYTGVVKRLREEASTAAPVQERLPQDVTIRELAKPQGAGVVLVAVAGNGAVYGFAEISVDSSRPVNGSPASNLAAVTGWYIQPAFRPRDIGRRLLESARAWATANGLNDLANPFDSKIGSAAARADLPEISPAAMTAST